jgi:hypothetical protein
MKGDCNEQVSSDIRSHGGQLVDWSWRGDHLCPRNYAPIYAVAEINVKDKDSYDKILPKALDPAQSIAPIENNLSSNKQ